jgi:hypothetical protein
MKVNIYELIDPRSNLPRYIGRTAGNIKTRLSNHLTEAKVNTSNSHRINWINELLKLNLKPIVNLIAVVDTEEWDVWEIFYIQLYKDLGYSLVNGSIGGDGFAPGSIPWNKGKQCSEQTKQKIRVKRKGQVMSAETRQKMSNVKKGKRPAYLINNVMSNEVKKKISNKLKGNIPWNKGQIMSAEIRQKMSKSSKGTIPSNKRKVKQFDMNMNFIAEHNSILEANKALGITSVGRALKSKYKKAGGYIWQ